ncbi:MAG: hypothetical protein E6J09_06000 [Chloroflexi bacterium]|nr:MAG: hypothetical protein E6J09_06000 [Chloroflexota bacterium]
MRLASSLDDATLVANARGYEALLRQRGVSVEAKYYENGGHMTLFQDATRQDARQRAIAFLKTNLQA